MSKLNVWKVWLCRNRLLSKNKARYTAEVVRTGTAMRNEDIAQQIKDRGSEYHYETVLSILNQAEDIICAASARGIRVLTGTAHYAPRVSGGWTGASLAHDPSIHKITLTITPGAKMKKALASVSLSILGRKGDSAYISLVNNLPSGDPCSETSPGNALSINGRKLKIAPHGEEGLGVFFIDAEGKEWPIGNRLMQNNKSRLIVQVPPLPPGKYTLQVRTRYVNGRDWLHEPRIMEYPYPVTVTNGAHGPDSAPSDERQAGT
jgi:hypothetical protein